MPKTKQVKKERSLTVSNAEEQTLKQESVSNSQPNIMQPVEPIASTTPELAVPASPMSVTTAETSGQEMISVPLDEIRNMAISMAQMREELNQLKMTGHIVPQQGPRTLLDKIAEMVTPIAQAIGKIIPQQDGGMNSRFMDYVFRGFEENLQMSSIVKEGVAKQLGVIIAPRAQHMIVTE